MPIPSGTATCRRHCILSFKTSCGKSKGSVLSGILQQALHCPQTKPKMAANTRSQCPQTVSQGQNLQNGNPGVHSPIFATGRRLLSHPYQPKLKEVSLIPVSGPNFPVSSAPIWPLYSSYGVHNCSQGGKAHGSGEKHPNAPIFGRLADPSQRQRYLFSGYPNPPSFVSGFGLGCEPQVIGTGAQTDFQFCRLPVRLSSGSSQAHPRKMGGAELQDQFSPKKDQLFSSTIHVLDKPSHSDRETGSIRTPPHEAHPMAPKDTLAHPGVLGEGHPDPQVPSSSPTVVVKGGKRSDRSTLAPPSSRGSDLYRRIKQRLGRTLRRLYRKRRLVGVGKQTAHQFSRIESGLVGPKSIRTPLSGLGSSGCY